MKCPECLGKKKTTVKDLKGNAHNCPFCKGTGKWPVRENELEDDDHARQMINMIIKK